MRLHPRVKGSPYIGSANSGPEKYIDVLYEYWNFKTKVSLLYGFIGHGKDLYMLANIRGALSEYMIADIAYQLLQGVNYLHKNGIVMKTLRP